jgi:hypothetical protein
MFRTAFRSVRGDSFSGFIPYLGQPLFSRFAVWKKMHPMSGGISRVRLDSVADYRELRKRQFDIDRAPLPKSLALSQADTESNRRVKLAN